MMRLMVEEMGQGLPPRLFDKRWRGDATIGNLALQIVAAQGFDMDADAVVLGLARGAKRGELVE